MDERLPDRGADARPSQARDSPGSATAGARVRRSLGEVGPGILELLGNRSRLTFQGGFDVTQQCRYLFEVDGMLAEPRGVVKLGQLTHRCS